jgi:Na+/proline symporter
MTDGFSGDPAPSGPYYPAPGYPAPPSYGFTPAAAYPLPPPEYRPVLTAEGPITSQTGWAITAIVLFWPVGIAAYLASLKVVPALMMGDYATAERESRRVKRFGIIAIIIVAVAVVFFVAIATIFAVAVSSCANEATC